MTYSSLNKEVMPPTGKYNGGNKWSARPAGVRINGLNVHHHAATSNAGINRLVTSNDPASANYIIRNNGSLIGSVPEEYRAWTTSAYANDDDKITVEIQNETGAPTWRISAAAEDTLVRLYADLARRYGFAPVRANLKGHQEYGIATACPGPYLLPRLDDVARKAAALNTPTAPPEVPDMDATQSAQLSTIHAAIPELLALFSGAAPRVEPSNGADEISMRTAMKWLLVRTQIIEATVTAQSAAITALASSAGLDAAEVLATFERVVREALPDAITIPLED